MKIKTSLLYPRVNQVSNDYFYVAKSCNTHWNTVGSGEQHSTRYLNDSTASFLIESYYIVQAVNRTFAAC
jgi:hypothetical protein